MIITTTVALDLAPQERFVVDHREQPHRVRLVHYDPEHHDLVLYGARVTKSGENANAVPILNRPLSDLPPHIVAVLKAAERHTAARTSSWQRGSDV